MKVNWKVRLHHKPFWMALIATLLVLGNQVASLFGQDFSVYNEQITKIAESVLLVLGLLGIVLDPTTSGVSDSDQAMLYYKPKDDK